MVTHLTSATFDETVGAADVVLVDFWATWCGPCKAMEPVLAAFADAHPEIVVGKVDVDAEAELAARFDVRGVPSLVLFVDGQVRGAWVGARPLALLEAEVTRALAP